MSNLELVKRVELPYNFEEAKEKFSETIKGLKGWSFPVPMWDFYKAVTSGGFELNNIKNMVVYFICNASYASQIVNSKPEISAVLPCTYVIFETNEDETYLASININMLGEMFDETIKNIINKVSSIEDEIIDKMLE